MMSQDMGAVLAGVAAVGYREVEFAGYFGVAPAEIRGLLDASGLVAPAAHVDLNQVDTPEALDRTLAGARVVGHRWLIVPSIPQPLRTVEGYARVADVLNGAGERAQPASVRIGFHNHAHEFAAIDGTTGFDLLAERLDPAYVDLEIDLHWAAVGGADPLQLFKTYPGRFLLCHVKGMAADRTMVDVGQGIIDWSAIFEQADEAGLLHYFVEHDEPEDPMASIEASFRYLTGGRDGEEVA